jgi:translation elongation factor EF-Tu-like GTPase
MYAGHSPDVEAEITFLHVEGIGGGSSVCSGYRPQFFYGGENYVVVLELIGKELVGPGDTVTAHLHLLHPELLYTHLKEGERFELREGSYTVAKGVITCLLDLLKNAASNR